MHHFAETESINEVKQSKKRLSHANRKDITGRLSFVKRIPKLREAYIVYRPARTRKGVNDMKSKMINQLKLGYQQPILSRGQIVRLDMVTINPGIANDV